MGIIRKLEKLKKEQKHNFNILADRIAKLTINISKLAEIMQTYGIVLSILKKKGIITEKEYRDELDNNNKDKKIPERNSL